jgi:hypothetical protein
MTPLRWSGSSAMAVAVAVAFAIPAVPAVAAPSCTGLQGCAAKACRIDAELATARSKGNTRLVASLERDKREEVHCSDDGLKQKRKVALEQAQRRVSQREAELKKAHASGSVSQKKKAQKNLDSAKKAYAEIRNSPL